MLSRYIQWCKNMHKTTSIWMDQTFSAVFQCCSDEELQVGAYNALYYMLYEYLLDMLLIVVWSASSNFGLKGVCLI